ncbi:GrpE protein HSP-70 cofactor [Sphaerotilus natans subsp. natans DSM 6575]|uniref:Protein GrpE n=3 Tax=Sphaerotilus natans TaxID=34103 RepID=A0A059KHA7_9BURK|nr:GrpE protein HSP-70 cofactor [Sphaerotilus natans subsp. natans DSM 6575]
MPMLQPLEATRADPMSHRDAAAAAKEETMSDTQNTPPFPDTEPASMNGAAAPADTSEAQARVAELEAKNVELADAYLRAKAEMENIRRRADEEVAKSRKFAVESFAESLLPVCDSLHAAIAAQSAGQGTPEQLLEGVQATLRQLSQALERNKVVELNPPAGTKFDPHQHQAISMVPADQDPNTVVSVLQKGYLIAERVLRPALVMVAAPK